MGKEGSKNDVGLGSRDLVVCFVGFMAQPLNQGMAVLQVHL